MTIKELKEMIKDMDDEDRVLVYSGSKESFVSFYMVVDEDEDDPDKQQLCIYAEN